jgi:hypothetical protein
VKMKLAAVVVAFAASGVASAADRPSGLDVWLTCRDDVKVVCPNGGLFNLGALKRCMKDNFSQLGPRCQAVVVRYHNGQAELASRSEPPRRGEVPEP